MDNRDHAMAEEDRAQELPSAGNRARTLRRIGFALCLLATESISGEVYKCADAAGKLRYQDQPCTQGTERPGDTPWDRAREQARKQEEARRRAEDEERARIAADAERSAAREKQFQAAQKQRNEAKLARARQCRNGTCDVYEFRTYLADLTRQEVEDGLGAPQHAQKVGSSEFWYYTIRLRDASGAALRRVQVAFEFSFRGELSVQTVNVY